MKTAPNTIISKTQPTISARRRWSALAVLMLPVLLVSVDNTVLAFAMPSISQALQPTGVQQLWIIDVYSLVLAGLLVPMGSFGDRIGRKKLLLIGSTGFALASALAAFSPNATWLIIGRASIGFFGAMLMPSTLSLIRNIFTHDTERRTAIAIWAAMFSGGAALGPIVGGFLLEHFQWGSIFLMGLVVLLPFLALAPWVLPESQDPNPGAVDILSIFLAISTMTPIVYAIKAVAESGLTPLNLLTATAGLICGALFIRRQLKQPIPMLDVRLFTNPTFTGAILGNLLAIFSLAGFIFFVSQHLQLVRGMSPMDAGIFLLPGLTVTVLAGLAVVKIVPKISPGTVVAGSLMLGAVAYGVVAISDNAATNLGLMIAFLMLGSASGAGETIANDLMLSSVPSEKSGAASAISEASYELGALLGTTVLGGIITAVYRSQIQLPQGLNADDAHHAQETLGGAVSVAQHLEHHGTELLTSAQHAFDSGVVWTAVISAILMALASIIVYRLLRQA
ncbi:MFS transporter [Rothia sp. P13129]|uniref:MFS transporter n=1 Tax=Rothia sp. P13129 TaxID=3402664 RepID=UPI003AD51178